MPKPRTRTTESSLARLLDRSSRPIYAVDAERHIVYCNPALAAWLGLEVSRIVGRCVEYHSESATEEDASQEGAGLLTGLCPPPKSLAGEPSSGTVACVALDGRLVHRRADFAPLAARPSHSDRTGAALSGGGVLVLLAEHDLSPTELATELSHEPSTDELHRAIRRFRRSQASSYAIQSLLGESAPMRKVRAQVLAAAASGANVLIRGPRGTGRSHVARAIHHHGIAGAAGKLLPVDCDVLADDQWHRLFELLSHTTTDGKHRPTLLLENLESCSPLHQRQLYDAIRQPGVGARLLATCAMGANAGEVTALAGESTALPSVDPLLASELSTITIDLIRLVERLDDLPILAQFFLEAQNRGCDKQVGSIRAQALDLLALHSWPNELNELREVMAAAHHAATTPEIAPADLPPVIHHAAKAASMPLRQPPERIVLDELLASIEKEAILRALAQTGGNKTDAAALLGMTRPRLYRRLVQLGLVSESAAEQIVFELDSTESQ